MSKNNKPYNGHKNWNHWNVSLWLNNDEGLYNFCREIVRRADTKRDAARRIVEYLTELSGGAQPRTPDGAPYSVSAVRAAIADM